MEQLFAILHYLQTPPDGLLDRLSSFLTEKHIKKKDYLLREGQVSSKLYFIVQGIIRAFYIDKNGEEVTTWFMQEKDFAFSVVSFYNQIPSFENIVALEDTTVLYITYDQLAALYKEFPAYNYHGRVLTEKYYARSMMREVDMIKKTAQERYQLLLEKEPHLLERASLKDIASYLGMTPVMLSRIRAERSLSK